MANPFTEAYDRDLRKLGRVLAERFINSGGTLELLIACFNEVTAARMLGKGQLYPAADGGQKLRADARQPNASGEGHVLHVQQDQRGGASPARSSTVEGGQHSIATQGRLDHALLHHPIASAEAGRPMPEKANPGLPPAREPKRKPPSDRHSEEQRAKDRAAARRVAVAAARGLLNSLKVPDGRGIGKCRLSEMTGKATDDLIMASVKLQIHAYGKSHLLTTDPLVEEVISERLLEKFLAEARREAKEPAVNKYQRGVVIDPEGHIGVMM